MKHHLVLYGPLQSQRPGTAYQDATTGDVAIGNVGLEWLLPGALLLVASVTLLSMMQVPLLHQAVFVGGTLVWSFLMFSYLHDRMHMAGFWMERNRWLRKWFVAARDAHDIHHCALNDQGFMDKNFGIAFFFFDRVFGTLASDPPAFNERGYASALSRFGDLLENSPGSNPADAECCSAVIERAITLRSASLLVRRWRPQPEPDPGSEGAGS